MSRNVEVKLLTPLTSQNEAATLLSLHPRWFRAGRNAYNYWTYKWRYKFSAPCRPTSFYSFCPWKV